MNNDPAYIYENKQYIKMLLNIEYNGDFKLRNLKIFILYYVYDWYLYEIGEKFDISSTRVRHILLTLKHRLKGRLKEMLSG